MCFARDKFTILQEGEREREREREREKSATKCIDIHHECILLTRNVSFNILWDFFASRKVVSEDPLPFLPVSGDFSPAGVLKNQQCPSQSQLHATTPSQRRMDINNNNAYSSRGNIEGAPWDSPLQINPSCTNFNPCRCDSPYNSLVVG